MQHLIYFITNYIGTSIWWWVGVSSYQIYFQDTHIKQQLRALFSNISAHAVFGGAQRLGFHHTLWHIVFCWCSRLAGPLLRSPDLIRPQKVCCCYFKLLFPFSGCTLGPNGGKSSKDCFEHLESFEWKPNLKKKGSLRTKPVWCVDSPEEETLILLFFHFLNFTSNPQ